MYNFIINFLKVIQDNLPVDLRVPIRLNRLQVYAKPFKDIYARFLIRKADLDYRCHFNGQKSYLQTALNDRFDSVNRRITIDDAFYAELFIYKKSELKPAIVMYKRWNSAYAFTTGQFTWYNGVVYVANANNTNKVPGIAAEWDITTNKAPVLRKKVNYDGTISFYVNVPSAVAFNQDEMKSLINYYKLAGPGYLIRTV